MLVNSLLLLLSSNAITLRRDKSILYSRVTITICILFIFVGYINLDFSLLNKGIGLFGGLFHTTCTTNVFHIFILLVTSIILVLTSFYPRKIWSEQYSSLFYSFFFSSYELKEKGPFSFKTTTLHSMPIKTDFDGHGLITDVKLKVAIKDFDSDDSTKEDIDNTVGRSATLYKKAETIVNLCKERSPDLYRTIIKEWKMSDYDKYSNSPELLIRSYPDTFTYPMDVKLFLDAVAVFSNYEKYINILKSTKDLTLENLHRLEGNPAGISMAAGIKYIDENNALHFCQYILKNFSFDEIQYMYHVNYMNFSEIDANLNNKLSALFTENQLKHLIDTKVFKILGENTSKDYILTIVLANNLHDDANKNFTLPLEGLDNRSLWSMNKAPESLSIATRLHLYKKYNCEVFDHSNQNSILNRRKSNSDDTSSALLPLQGPQGPRPGGGSSGLGGGSGILPGSSGPFSLFSSIFEDVNFSYVATFILSIVGYFYIGFNYTIAETMFNLPLISRIIWMYIYEIHIKIYCIHLLIYYKYIKPFLVNMLFILKTLLLNVTVKYKPSYIVQCMVYIKKQDIHTLSYIVIQFYTNKILRLRLLLTPMKNITLFNIDNQVILVNQSSSLLLTQGSSKKSYFFFAIVPLWFILLLRYNVVIGNKTLFQVTTRVCKWLK